MDRIKFTKTDNRKTHEKREVLMKDGMTKSQANNMLKHQQPNRTSEMLMINAITKELEDEENISKQRGHGSCR